MRRNILVTGATGKQGGALIRALLQPTTSNSTTKYHVYALTRKASSPTAQRLLATHGTANLTIVEGDLEDSSSITAIFETAKLDSGSADAEPGIWGVFAVMAFPGLGASAEGEEKQGKLLADVALEYGVKAYVYSSALRAGPKHEDQIDGKASWVAKRNIEVHCQELGMRGLSWIILRPSFFMENFNDFVGSIAVTVLKKGLKDDTTLGLIATEDIGNVAFEVFVNYERYIHKVLSLVSEFSTMRQIEESYQNAMGRPVPAVPGPLGWLLLKINKGAQDLVNDMELNHKTRASGDYPELEGEITLAQSAYKLKTYYEWVRQDKKEESLQQNWNQISLGKLLTGRS